MSLVPVVGDGVVGDGGGGGEAVVPGEGKQNQVYKGFTENTF